MRSPLSIQLTHREPQKSRDQSARGKWTPIRVKTASPVHETATAAEVLAPVCWLHYLRKICGAINSIKLAILRKRGIFTK